MHKWYEKSGPDSETVLSCRVRLARNFADLPFPSKMSRSDLERSRERVKRALSLCTRAQDYRYILMEEMTESEAVSFAERQLCTPEFIAKTSGRALFFTSDEGDSITVNGADHLRIQILRTGNQLSEALEVADQLDTQLDRSLRFAFRRDLGYLTQSPMDLGTGMVAGLQLHLPALEQLGEMDRICTDLIGLGFVMRSLYGTDAAIYEMRNRITLGISETEAVQNLSALAKQVIMREKQAREEMLSQPQTQEQIRDSLGILQTARILPQEVFFGCYSKIRVGIFAGLIRGLTAEQLDTLKIAVQPATLTVQAGRELDAKQCQIRRAQLISTALQGVRLC